MFPPAMLCTRHPPPMDDPLDHDPLKLRPFLLGKAPIPQIPDWGRAAPLGWAALYEIIAPLHRAPVQTRLCFGIRERTRGAVRRKHVRRLL